MARAKSASAGTPASRERVMTPQDPIPAKPSTPSSPEPQKPWSPTPMKPQKSAAGRPSKLETRAWEVFSRTANVAMSHETRRDRFREALVIARDFEHFWRTEQ